MCKLLYKLNRLDLSGLSDISIVSEQEIVSEKEQIVAKKTMTIFATDNECPICYDVMGDTNKCITECGHSYCLSCLLHSYERNTLCPCCRTEMCKRENVEEDDEDDEEEEDDEDEDDEDEEEEDEEEEQEEGIYVEDIATRMETKGYNMKDMIAFITHISSREDNQKYTREFMHKMVDDVEIIMQNLRQEVFQENSITLFDESFIQLLLLS